MPDFNKLLDRVKQLAGKHPDQVNKGVDKGEQVADEKTGGKYGSQIQEAGDFSPAEAVDPQQMPSAEDEGRFRRDAH